MRLFLSFAVCLLVLLPARAQQPTCTAPAPVCDARAAVFPISAFDPVGSAVRIGEEMLVSARHVIADSDEVVVFLPNGTRTRAIPVPSAYPGDIVLLHAYDLPPGPVLEVSEIDPDATLFTIGVDVSFGTVRAYDPGTVTLLPAPGKPLARLHHSAYSQPGNSGGALVDDAGRLMAIIASGGEGRDEAIPATTIATLREMSGQDFVDQDAEIDAAIRICTLTLDAFRDPAAAMTPQDAKAVATACRRTGNRQYFDNAAQALGTRGLFDESIALFEASLEQDPHTLNGRLGLATTYHIAARYEDELPHLRFLLEHIPEDPQVVRLAIQAGTWAGDTEMARAALETLRRTNPNLVSMAERFIEAPPPRPEPR
ncbi:MAG: trypsin-like peptidase domain-containing protein [Rhodospirillales bacterium]